MSLDTLDTIESALDLGDFVNKAQVLADAEKNGTDFDTAVRAQVEAAGMQATDEAIAEFVAELEAEAETEA